MKTKTLQELLPGLVADKQQLAMLEINDLALDSRNIKPGSLFFAYPGVKTDGRNFIQQAVVAGAKVILAEKNHATFDLSQISVPVVLIDELQAKIGFIAARFYDYPSRDLQMIGVTGTNGKTSTSHFIARILNANKKPCGVIGTLGFGFPDQITELARTTPDAAFLQQCLANFRQQGVQACAMEVSSHALDQGRVNGIDFDMAVFTNLTHEHLDYHGDLETYGLAKKKLFAFESLKCAVINADDNFGWQLISELKTSLPIIVYSAQHPKTSLPAVVAEKVICNSDGIIAQVSTPWGKCELRSKLLGKFNLSNLLASLAVAGNMGMPLPNIVESINSLANVAGRMETYGGKDQPLVVVDFAHTPDALSKVLASLREHCEKKLWCVFGCGGDRDKLKRPKMAEIAEKWSDRVVVTSDNPRTEEPLAIITDITKGLQQQKNAIIEPDRGLAIKYALANANVGDIVLIAGKGHESYQIFGSEKKYFSDSAEVKKYLGVT